ncbi:MAG: PepSY-like domain-containing protein, partial [Parafilimonas sp.]
PVDNTAVNMNLDAAAVPMTVRTSFEKKYPQATNPKWAKYQPMEDSYKDMYPDMDLDTSDYWVIYTWNDIDYMTWYDTSGDWIRTTNTITNDKLPAAINTAIQKDYAGYNIVKVEEEMDKGEKKYEVKLEKGDEKIKLHFRPSGEIIKAKTKS